eukprot:12102-Heterococcus_DN1.PRE.2
MDLIVCQRQRCESALSAQQLAQQAGAVPCHEHAQQVIVYEVAAEDEASEAAAGWYRAGYRGGVADLYAKEHALVLHASLTYTAHAVSDIQAGQIWQARTHSLHVRVAQQLPHLQREDIVLTGPQQRQQRCKGCAVPTAPSLCFRHLKVLQLLGYVVLKEELLPREP